MNCLSSSVSSDEICDEFKYRIFSLFEYPFENPQRNIVMPAEFDIPTRLVMKDNHRPCVPKPQINDMNPQNVEGFKQMTQPVEAAPTDSLYQYGRCG